MDALVFGVNSWYRELLKSAMEGSDHVSRRPP